MYSATDIKDVVETKMVTEGKTGGWKLQVNELENGKYEVEVYWFCYIGEVPKLDAWSRIFNTQVEAQEIFDSIKSLQQIKNKLQSVG